ncbi:MAG: PilZ domain-containing protein [Gammaproteobacteria bacterium]|nr:PilZ domain-containing protein [Gammaproteobacteria bacterium]
MTTNQRDYERIAHRANIRVLTSPQSEVILEMRDFSETGMFLFCTDEVIVERGNKVEVQTLEIDDAPILLSEVVRVEPNLGFAVKFLL